MLKVARQVLLTALVMAPFTAAWAQPSQGPRLGGFGRDASGLDLLAQKSVQDELKLSEDQRSKATQFAEKQREGFQELRNLSRDERQKKFEERAVANRKAVAEILDPSQTKRLRQITLQQQGAAALADFETADALQLTSDQKQKLKAILDETRDKVREAFEGGRDGVREKLETTRKSAQDKAAALLTHEQQAKWKELAGEPFKGEIRWPDFRGGGGDRRGQRGPENP